MWERAAVCALQQVVAALRAGPGRFAFVSLTLTGQMAGLVLVGRGGEPLYAAIPWHDRRAQPQVAALCAKAPGFYAVTGCPPSAAYPAVKLLWLQEAAGGRMPGVDPRPLREALRAVRWVLSPRDELLRRLTGEIATDPSCAGATGLFDTRMQAWDPGLCAAVGVELGWLPPIRAASDVVGRLAPRLSVETGLPPGLPVVVGAGDGVTQSLGTGCVEGGQLTLSLGTSGVVRAVTAQPLRDRAPSGPPRSTLYPFLSAGGRAAAWAVTGATANGAGVLRWLEASVLGAPLPMAQAGALPAGCDGLMFLPYLSGERSPLWEPAARGVWFGLTPDHGAAHLTRSAVEGVALALRAVTDALRQIGVESRTATLAGGGAVHPLIRRLLADVLALPVATLPNPGLETVRGAAVLGEVARLREHGSAPDELAAARQVIARLVPAPISVTEPGAEARVYTALYARFTELTQRLVPVFRNFYAETAAAADERSAMVDVDGDDTAGGSHCPNSAPSL